MENATQTLLKTENQPEIDEVIEFVGELTPEERRGFLNFIHGVKFAKRIEAQGECQKQHKTIKGKPETMKETGLVHTSKNRKRWHICKPTL